MSENCTGSEARLHLELFFFILMLAEVIKITKEQIKNEHQITSIGVRIGGETIADLGYSDDMTLIEEEISKIEIFLKTFVDNSKRIGLELNISKTKAMQISKEGRKHFKINIKGQDIETVDNFEYLGVIISAKGEQEKAIDHRISKGWAAFSMKMQVLISSSTSRSVKKNII